MSETFDWRASIAEIDGDAAFAIPGYQRHQILLRGNGFLLHFDDDMASLEPPHSQHRYAGDMPVSARLIDGPVHAFNLIWRPGSQRTRAASTAGGATLFFPEPGVEWVIIVHRRSRGCAAARPISDGSR